MNYQLERAYEQAQDLLLQQYDEGELTYRQLERELDDLHDRFEQDAMAAAQDAYDREHDCWPH